MKLTIQEDTVKQNALDNPAMTGKIVWRLAFGVWRLLLCAGNNISSGAALRLPLAMQAVR
jgi:hypothetical protein